LTEEPYRSQGLTITAIAGKGGGKSNLNALLCELAHDSMMPFMAIDPNGDLDSLQELGDDVLVIGKTNRQGLRQADYDIEAINRDPADYIRDYMLDQGFSLVLDLSGKLPEAKAEIVSIWLSTWYTLSEDDRYRRPTMLVIDEAHIFAPQSKPSEAQAACLKAMSLIASDGRKRGIAAVYVTQRMAFINKDVVGLSNVWLVGYTTFYDDYKRMKLYLPDAASYDRLSSLKSGQFYLVGARGHGLIQVNRRRTTDLGETPAFETVQRPRPSKADLGLRPKQLSMLPTDKE
jgi:DNA helicase HerA-like ATPase